MKKTRLLAILIGIMLMLLPLIAEATDFSKWGLDTRFWFDDYSCILVPQTLVVVNSKPTYYDKKNDLTMEFTKTSTSYETIKRNIKSAFDTNDEMSYFMEFKVNGIEVCRGDRLFSHEANDPHLTRIAFSSVGQTIIVDCMSKGSIFDVMIESLQVSTSPVSKTNELTFFNNVVMTVPSTFYTYTAASGNTYYRDRQSDIIMNVKQDTIVSDYEGLSNLIKSKYSLHDYAEFTNDNGIKMIVTLEESTKNSTATYFFISNNKLVYIMFVYNTENAENISTDIIDSIYLLSIPSSKPASPEKVKAFVQRCYKLILNREADEGGLKGWSDALCHKTAAAANIIDGFVKSDEFTNRKLSAEAKVDILYKTMLNREADAGGKAGWVDALSKGYTLQNIINGFCGSAEFKALCQDYGIEPGTVEASVPADASTPRGKIEAFVKRCYQLILNRQADEGGLKGWSDALEGKTAAAAQIIDGFVRSPEYINRKLTNEQSVTILYKTMLDREPDEGGKAGWVDALSKGYTLQHIINGFCGSAEFTKICSDYGIEAGSVAVPVQSAAALEAAAQLEAKKLPDERIGNAVSADDAGITVVNGYEPAEVEAFVKHAYRAALGREADEAGLAGWTEQIVSGAAAPKAFLRTLLFSDEQIARKLNNEQFIEMLYRLYLNRGMDDAAAERIAQLAAGGLEEVIKGFESSAEFRLVLNGFGL